MCARKTRITVFGLMPALAATPEAPMPGTGTHDWPQYGRTVQRNMISDETGLPASFEVGDETNAARNIKWTAALGRSVYGAPVIANGKVYVVAGSNLYAIQRQ